MSRLLRVLIAESPADGLKSLRSSKTEVRVVRADRRGSLRPRLERFARLNDIWRLG